MFKRLAPLLFILGLVAICAFLVPVQKFYSTGTETFYKHIFWTDGSIDYGRFTLFIAVWILGCIALHFIVRDNSLKK